MTMARVLVIEDDASNLDVAQRIIRAAGHQALSATDGASGLETARAEHPDAILVDLLLPRMDGWSVTKALREEACARGSSTTRPPSRRRRVHGSGPRRRRRSALGRCSSSTTSPRTWSSSCGA